LGPFRKVQFYEILFSMYRVSNYPFLCTFTLVFIYEAGSSDRAF